jgi:hypothetical protein
MISKELEQKLIQWSAVNSGYDEHRPYIGLSGIGDCSLVIYRRFFNQTGASTESRLKTRYAYEVEENIKQRLMALGLYSPGKEISIYDGLVQGHTDGEFNRDLLEIKTVPLTEHIPRDNEIPRKPYWQSQAYMLYGHYTRSIMIYFARDYGILRVFEISRSSAMGDRISSKVDALVESVRAKVSPPCDCGRCQRKEI